MAARRLIVVLVVLLGISIAAAAIAPDRQSTLLGNPDESEETTTQEEPPADPEEPRPSGELVRATITADPEDPETVRAAPGDQIELQIEARRPVEVSIEAFGLLAPAEPDAPARFSLLLRDAGELAITDAESGVIVGRIISEAGDRRPPEDGGDGRPDEGKEPSGDAAKPTAEPV